MPPILPIRVEFIAPYVSQTPTPATVGRSLPHDDVSAPAKRSSDPYPPSPIVFRPVCPGS
ncbi:hypothetical protein OH76DRAFT_1412550 [Lentinus brumalis]|uniref:Uncharacterized protein n=1 Tax=Lentinus brumalis TaxID=2498619 RepID=A0A371CKX7_9APHY|nr:hypothetical protein OH76DRAFT_1412550 [Polyporus brumalis]